MRYKGKKNRRRRQLIRRVVLCLLLACIMALAVKVVVDKFGKPKTNTGNNSENTASENTNNESGSGEDQSNENQDPTKTGEVSIRIRCAGDIMVHSGSPQNQMENALQSDGSYDFSPTFKYVAKWLEDADVTFAQFEACLSGDGYYSGYPLFITPDVLADNVKATGVDVALFANNHMLDNGVSGSINSVNILRRAGFNAVAGARADTAEARSPIIEVNGLKIGVVAFAYETQRVDGMRTMNGMYMHETAPDYINSFRYEYGSDGQYHVMNEDLELIKSEMEYCRQAGAEIVICYFHWGTEYQFSPDYADQELARFAVANGADIIFASHPHVIQPVEIVDGVPVFYALGNFVSNQRYETLTLYYDYPELISRRTEQGLIGNVELTYNYETGKITYDDVSVIPTWVDKYAYNGRWYHQIIPLLDDLDSNEALQISGNTQRAKNALADITEFIGSEFIYKEN